MANLLLVLGDQLSTDLASLSHATCDDLIVMGELKVEATYVRHHPKKIALIFSAMRHFAIELRERGLQVEYHEYDPESETASFTDLIQQALAQNPNRFSKILLTFPGEVRVLKEFKRWQDDLELPVEILDDTRFFVTPKAFKEWAGDKNQLTMEHFYRWQRQTTDVLMEGDEPVGGQYNFDKQNREPPKQKLNPPKAYDPRPDEITLEVLDLVEAHFGSHFGDLRPFHLGVNRREALEFLNRFIEERFEHFGAYQDAMMAGEPFMYHSLISFYLNIGLLSAREVVEKAEAALETGAPINSVEGFIRQILGWREFVRGVYWLKSPDYESKNLLNHQRALPSFFWSESLETDTHMTCLRESIGQTREHAYAHHIQRLMVIGNFCLLAGINPREVQEWYLAVYADAFEWVELPNVVGMILYADDSFATKPYAASGAYINRMSNYCKDCHYTVSHKNGDSACPFNYLYWNFFLRHQERFDGNNPRLNRTYAPLNRFDDKKIQCIQSDAQSFLDQLN